MGFEPPRTHQSRPWISTPDGDVVTYTRTSKLAETLGDSYALDLWHNKATAIGIAENPWIAGKVLAASKEPEEDKWNGRVRMDHYDHNELLKWIAVAQAHAGTEVQAKYGDQLHELSELVDHGIDVELDQLDDRVATDIAAYEYFTEELKVVETEQFCVNDEARCAGTYDKLIDVGGTLRMVDLKSGRLKPMQMEMQLALYARSKKYRCLHDETFDEHHRLSPDGCKADPAAHEREDLGVAQDWGVILHLEATTGRLTPYQADLAKGWQNVQLALKVREARKAELQEMELADLIEGIPF